MYSYKYQTFFSQCTLNWSWLVRTWSTRQMNIAPESMENNKYRRVVITDKRPIARFSPMLENNSRNILASGELKSENLSRNLRVTWLSFGNNEVIRETRNYERCMMKKRVTIDYAEKPSILLDIGIISVLHRGHSTNKNGGGRRR